MKKYTIPKGEHSSDHPIKLYTGKSSFNFSVNFDESCRYDLGTIDQLDINKLAGISFGYHQTNSIRIGWAYNVINQNIDLYSYCYLNGNRLTDTIGSCSIGVDTSIKLNLNFKANTFNITLNGGTNHEFIYKYPFLKLGYYLYPYFGGNNPAPHEMVIYLDGIYFFKNETFLKRLHKKFITFFIWEK